MAFTEAQVKHLEAKLNSKHVRTRQAHDAVLTYVEGWHVIAEANRIFGYDAWDRQTLSPRCVWSGMTNKQHAASYIAKVRIVVRAGSIAITREGCGSGDGKAASPGEAHEFALKAAETDATKRALATFGNPFGLALYDRELAGVRNRKALERPEEPTAWTLREENGTQQTFDTPEAFATALETALSALPDIERLFALVGGQCRDRAGFESLPQPTRKRRSSGSRSCCPSQALCRRFGEDSQRTGAAVCPCFKAGSFSTMQN